VSYEIGMRFGRLTIISLTKGENGKATAHCRCDCGRAKTVRPHSMKSGNTLSCGCLHRERASEAKTTHGHTRNRHVTQAYRAWVNIHTRCENPKASKYEFYGARGISVGDRWRSLENFLADVGEPPTPAHSLDRYPNLNGNYEPENIRWATRTEQARNTRANRAVIRSDGARYDSLAEAAEAIGGDSREIWAVCNKGNRRTHRGFGWSYA